jgi:hypothetical protein
MSSWAFHLDFYTLLAVNEDDIESPEISQLQRLQLLQQAYHSQSRQIHPDKGGSDEHFKQIHAAYEILTDNDMKTRWTQWRASQAAPAAAHPDPASQPAPGAAHPEPAAQHYTVKQQHLHDAVEAFQVFLTLPPRKDPLISPDRARVAARRQALKGLLFAPELATFFEAPLATMVDVMLVQGGRLGFEGIFKDLSHEGYDVVSNRKIDYGNFQYKSALICMAMENAEVHSLMCRFSTVVPTLHPDYSDTEDSLSKQGDVIEVLMAFCRGAEFVHCPSIRRFHTNAEWSWAYVKLCALCNSIDLLYCHLDHSRSSKRNPYNGPAATCRMLGEVRNSVYKHTQAMARVGKSIRNFLA